MTRTSSALTEEDPAGAEPAIDVRGVRKRYGKHWALHGVDMQVQRGEIVGFIGPNGSGKSSLMRIIAGLARANAGTVRVLSSTVDGHCSPPGLGLVLEQQGHLPYLSATRNLAMLGSLTGHGGKEEIAAALRRVGLDPADRRPVARWSFGMRQRLTLAQAILDQPRVLLLDEPTNGLDPAGVAELRAVLSELVESGVGILLASHALTEVERLCRRAYFVRDGRIVEVLDADTAPTVGVQASTTRDLEALRQWAVGVGLEITCQPGGLWAELPLTTAMPGLIRTLAGISADLEQIRVQRPSLEQRFIDLVGGK